MKGEIDSLLAQIGQMAGEVETGDLPAFLGRLEALRASSWARLARLGEERAALCL